MAEATPNPMNTQKYRGLTSSQPGKRRFDELSTYKNQWLTRVRECSRLTKPLVVPPSGHTAGASVDIPHASHGARYVSNLVSQLLLILFPPGMTFFKLDLENSNVREMAKGLQIAQDKSMYDALRESFVTIESNATILMETLPIREKLRMILMETVTAGCSGYIEGSDDLELIPLTDWACVRSASGDLLEVVYRRHIPVDDTTEKSLGVTLDKSIVLQGITEVYTRCYFNGRQWISEDFLETANEPHKSRVYNPEKFPVHITNWELFAGEDYGRGAVEENLGDLRTLESGTQIVKDSSTALSKAIFMVRPNGMTKVADVARAENTEIISGDKDDVGVIQANKAYDMGGFVAYLQSFERNLDIAFMMPTVVRREAERVTAEEIRRMAAEFERSRGGVYNSLSMSLQGPIARFLVKTLVSRGGASTGNLSASDLVPIVNTGLQGLGRQLELENLQMFMNDMLQLQMGHLLNPHKIAHRLGTLRSLEVSSFLKTPEELALEQQQAAAEQMVQTAAPHMIKGAVEQ